MEKRTTNIIKIAIVGPESTGKSTLAQALALHFNEPWVPEYARTYIAELQRPYLLNDIVEIAQHQLLAENEAIKNAHQFLFCDTNLLVNKIWAQFVFNQIPNEINYWYQPHDYALHLLCDIDLPWEADPLREHPNQRAELLEMYRNDLTTSNANYFLISGREEQRLNQAIQIIQQQLV